MVLTDTLAAALQGALALLEAGWERGARSPRLAALLGAARALTGEGEGWRHGRWTGATGATGATGEQAVLTRGHLAAVAPTGLVATSARSRRGAGTAPKGSSAPGGWGLGLADFTALPPAARLRLLLGGATAEELEAALEEW